MRYGIQMFGLNPIFLEDKEGFLRRVTEAGYRYMEPCLMLETIPGLEKHGWTEADFEANYPLLEKYGVSIHSCHVFTQDLSANLAKVLDLAKKYGIRQIVLPCPKDVNPATAVYLTQVGDALKKHDVQLLLHNGKDDLGYGWLLSVSGDSVGAQVDVGWLLYHGIDPETFLWKHQKKVRSLHYKDFEDTPDGLRETTVGRGKVDMMACFQFARANEIIQLVDQDGSQGDFMEDVESVAETLRGLSGGRDRSRSILCIFDTETGEVTKLKSYDKVIEAPNWLQTNDDYLFYNSDGRIWRYQISTGEEVLLESGICTNCNNDHVLSPDNTRIAVSHSQTGWMSQIYILPLEGGEPRLITPNAPSFLHGWSPDGEELAYCAFRDHGKGTEVDVYAIPARGGEEKQLTAHAAFNDGPEYAPNGKHIWFNSTRTGLMQCWRMNRDGSEPVQMTFTERNNWFPHVSPDGKQVVYLSYSRDGLDAAEHLPNMHVQLRLMNADGSDDRCILEFFGGQGSINVNSWHSGSKKFAFVMYELEHK